MNITTQPPPNILTTLLDILTNRRLQDDAGNSYVTIPEKEAQALAHELLLECAALVAPRPYLDRPEARPPRCHTCPLCSSILHRSAQYAAWTTPDGRVFIEADTARPTDQKWLELPPSAQGWLTEVFRLAREQALEANAQRVAS